MKRIKDLVIFLSLELGSVVWAAGVFSIISNKRVAGLIGGAYFLGFSLVILFRILRWPKWWQSWTLYPLLLFLFGCTIPMLGQRLLHFSQAFDEIRIWGIPGPEFHHISASTLGLLILVSLAETAKEILKKASVNRV